MGEHVQGPSRLVRFAAAVVGRPDPCVLLSGVRRGRRRSEDHRPCRRHFRKGNGGRVVRTARAASCCRKASSVRNATAPISERRRTFSTSGSIRVRAASRCSRLAAIRFDFPADVYLEGGDQYRGWFNSSLSCGIAAHDSAPYKQIITHGWVVDGEGKKQSKSIGNVTAPQEIIDKSGAEVLRLWAAAVDYTEDVRCSDEILLRVVDAYRKFRNTLRYALGNLDGFDPATDAVAPSEMLEIDRWALASARRADRKSARGVRAIRFSGCLSTRSTTSAR